MASTVPDFDSLSRAELQSLCKQHGIKANGKTVDLVAALREKLAAVTSAEAKGAANNVQAEVPATVALPTTMRSKRRNSASSEILSCGRATRRRFSATEDAFPPSNASSPPPHGVEAPGPMHPIEENETPSLRLHCVVHGTEAAGDRASFSRLVLRGGRVFVDGVVPFLLSPTQDTPVGCEDNLLCSRCAEVNLLRSRQPPTAASTAQNSSPTGKDCLASSNGGKAALVTYAQPLDEERSENVPPALAGLMQAAAPVAEMKDPLEEEILRSRKNAVAERRLSSFKSHRHNGETPKDARRAAAVRAQSEKRLAAVMRRRGVDLNSDSPIGTSALPASPATPSAINGLRAYERRRSSAASQLREDSETARKVDAILASTARGSEEERRMSMEPSVASPVRRSPIRRTTLVQTVKLQHEARRRSSLAN